MVIAGYGRVSAGEGLGIRRRDNGRTFGDVSRSLRTIRPPADRSRDILADFAPLGARGCLVVRVGNK